MGKSLVSNEKESSLALTSGLATRLGEAFADGLDLLLGLYELMLGFARLGLDAEEGVYDGSL